MNIPMALRRIKPGVAHLATNVFLRHPELLNSLPATTPKQRIWLLAVNWAFNKVNQISARGRQGMFRKFQAVGIMRLAHSSAILLIGCLQKGQVDNS